MALFIEVISLESLEVLIIHILSIAFYRIIVYNVT